MSDGAPTARLRTLARWAQQLRAGSLARNSGHLLLSTIVTSLGGFLFWQIATRLLTQSEVGDVATLIAAAMLLATFGLVGMDMAVLHHINRWPESKGDTAMAGLGVVAAATALAAGGFVAGARVFVPHVDALRHPAGAVAFVVLTVAVSTNLFLDSVFISLRASQHVLVRTALVNAVRLLGPLAVASLSGFAVFAVYTGGTGLALATGLAVLSGSLGLRLRARVDRGRLRQMWRFSAANYVALTVSGAPIFVLPVMISAVLGSDNTAVFFLAALISGLLTSIPQATSQSLYAEVAADPAAAPPQVRHAVRLTALYEAPALGGLLVAGWPVLRLFGPGYTDGYPVLAILSVSGALASAGYLGRTILLAAGRLRLLTAYAATFCVLALGACALAVRHGIVAVALAWLAAEAITAALYARVIVAAARGRLLGTPPHGAAAVTPTATATAVSPRTTAATGTALSAPATAAATGSLATSGGAHG